MQYKNVAEAINSSEERANKVKKEIDSQNAHFDIDKDFKKVGEFGYYQLLVFLLIGFTACIPALIVHTYPFVSGTPDFR